MCQNAHRPALMEAQLPFAPFCLMLLVCCGNSLIHVLVVGIMAAGCTDSSNEPKLHQEMHRKADRLALEEELLRFAPFSLSIAPTLWEFH